MIEAVPCAPDDVFEIVFEAAEPRWRQGIWLGVEGTLAVGSTLSSQMVLWNDTAPERVLVRVVSTSDGLLRLYNVWDSGRGRQLESQVHTSGMIREELPRGARYRCSDINAEPTFAALVFRMERLAPT